MECNRTKLERDEKVGLDGIDTVRSKSYAYRHSFNGIKNGTFNGMQRSLGEIYTGMTPHFGGIYTEMKPNLRRNFKNGI